MKRLFRPLAVLRSDDPEAGLFVHVLLAESQEKRKEVQVVDNDRKGLRKALTKINESRKDHKNLKSSVRNSDISMGFPNTH